MTLNSKGLVKKYGGGGGGPEHLEMWLIKKQMVHPLPLALK